VSETPHPTNPDSIPPLVVQRDAKSQADAVSARSGLADEPARTAVRESGKSELERIEARLESRRSRLATAIRRFQSFLPVTACAERHQVLPPADRADFVEALADICVAVREGEFVRGIEDILDRAAGDANHNLRNAVRLYERAWKSEWSGVGELLDQLDQLSTHPPALNPDALCAKFVWEEIRRLTGLLLAGPDMAVHPWHSDWIDARRLRAELAMEADPAVQTLLPAARARCYSDAMPGFCQVAYRRFTAAGPRLAPATRPARSVSRCHMSQVTHTSEPIGIGPVLRLAIALRDSLRCGPPTWEDESRAHSPATYLRLLERALNPHRVAPSEAVEYRISQEVDSELTELRALCYAIADEWHEPNIWSPESVHDSVPFSIPALRDESFDRLDGVVNRLQKESPIDALAVILSAMPCCVVYVRSWFLLELIPDTDPAYRTPPADGQFVSALPRPAQDANAAAREIRCEAPCYPRLAPLWTNCHGEWVLSETDGFLLGHCSADAVWLPEGWTMDVYPAGWTLAHIEKWFEYALYFATKTDRADLGEEPEDSPAYAPSAWGAVVHAHLIVRHLGLPGSPREPREEMSRNGCIAELRDVLQFFRRMLTDPQAVVRAAGGFYEIDSRQLPLEAPAGTDQVLAVAYNACARALFEASEIRREPPKGLPLLQDSAKSLSGTLQDARTAYAAAELRLRSATDDPSRCPHHDAIAAAESVSVACSIVLLPEALVEPGDGLYEEAMHRLQFLPHFDAPGLLQRMRHQVSKAMVLFGQTEIDQDTEDGQSSENGLDSASQETSSVPQPDGPFGVDGFRFCNVSVSFRRAALQRKLVLALWDQANRTPREARKNEDVICEVYGEEHDTSDAAFRQLCADTRRRFEARALPLTIELLQGYVRLKPLPE
jgi:hypothetical protein